MRVGRKRVSVEDNRLEHAAAADELDRGQSRGQASRACHGVATVRVARQQLPAGLTPEWLGDPIGHEYDRQRAVAAGYTFTATEKVRPDTRVLRREPLTRTAEARDDLVENQQDVVLVTYRPQRPHVLVRRHDHASRHEDRLGDDGRDGFGSF